MAGEVVDTGAANPSEVDFVALRPGQTIGRYTVVSVLGQGGLKDGTYAGSMNITAASFDCVVQLSVRMANGSGTGTVTNPRCGALPISLKVDPSGMVTGEMSFTIFVQCGSGTSGKVRGQAEGSQGIRLEMEGTTTSARGRGKIRLGAAP